jgi:hypothetical protein
MHEDSYLDAAYEDRYEQDFVDDYDGAFDDFDPGEYEPCDDFDDGYGGWQDDPCPEFDG